MKLYLCSTYYHVLVTLLKQFANPEPADLVICDDLVTGDQLACRIRSAHLFRNVWFVKQHELPEVPAKNIVDAIVFQHRRRARTLRPLLPFSVRSYSHIDIYHDGTALGSYLNDEGVGYHLIEDSLNFYQYVRQSSQAHLLPPHTLRYWIRRLLRAGYFPLGYSPHVLDIEVNSRSGLQIPSRKVVEKPRSALTAGLSPEQISLIYSLFGFEPPQESGKNSAVILTQPLCRDGVCHSREEQLRIYREIAEVLLETGYTVYMKPHPRDDVSYAALPVSVIERYFPTELFSLGRQDLFACAVTIDSSSLSVFPAKRKWYWDIQRHQLYSK